MRYSTIEELPLVCRINLPEAALHVYKDAYNHAWQTAGEESARDRIALQHAWTIVRDRFEKDALTGRWVPKTTPLKARVARTPKAKASRKRPAIEVVSAQEA